MLFSNPVSLFYAVPTVLLLTLPHVSETTPISAALPLTDVVSGLIYRPAVFEEADVVRLCLTLEVCV